MPFAPLLTAHKGLGDGDYGETSIRGSQFREHAHIMRKSTYAIFDLDRGRGVIGDRANVAGEFEPCSVRHWARPISGAVWHLLRIPVLLLLVILEPVIAFLCGGLALLGVLATVFFTVVHAPHFPVWTYSFCLWDF